MRRWQAYAAITAAVVLAALLAPLLLYVLFALFDKGPAWLR